MLRSVVFRACSLTALPLESGISCHLPSLQATSILRTVASTLQHQSRAFAASPQPDEDEEVRTVGSSRINSLAKDICSLSLMEVAELVQQLSTKLQIDMTSSGGMAMGFGGGGPATSAAAAGVEPAEAKQEEKTEFDVKLEGFDAAAKIKVIKEVRAITSLGLKEAKELVEKAPTLVKGGLQKEEAEALKKTLEAAGAKVTLA